MATTSSSGGPSPPTLWRDGLFWLALLLSLFAIAPFALPGYFWGANDARHHVYFLFEFNRLVEDGIWWPRWSPDFAFGYGYPFFNIYGPLSHLVAELFLRFGRLSYTGAVESVFALGILGAAGAMYGYVRSLAGRAAGLIGAVAYTYAPYHLLVLYVRANLAEASAFVWLPLCLWGFRATVLRPSRWNILGAGLAYGGLMLTSNLVIVLFTPLLVAYILALLVASRWRKPDLWNPLAWLRQGLAPALGGLTGLGLSAIFWIPMALERRYVRLDQWFQGRYDFRDDFLYFFQLFSPRWDFGVSGPGPDDTMGFQIGPVLLLLALLGGLYAWRHRPLWPEVGILALAAGVATFLGLWPAAPLWELPLLGSILQAAQFPWRWLPLTVLGLSVLAGLAWVDEEDGPQARAEPLTLPVLAGAAVLILASYPLLQVEIQEPAEGPVSLAALMRFQRDADEMTGSTVWVREIPTWSPMAEYYIRQDEAGGPVEPVTTKVDYANVDYRNLALGSVAHNTVMEEVYFCTNPGDQPHECSPRDDQVIVFNHFYYPGWRAYLLDGLHGEPIQELPVVPEDGPLGRMTVPIPPVGEGYILLRFEDTPPRIIGKWISLGTLALWVGLLAVPLAHGRRPWRQGREEP